MAHPGSPYKAKHPVLHRDLSLGSPYMVTVELRGHHLCEKGFGAEKELLFKSQEDTSQLDSEATDRG